ncbi:unnamed protein product [Linum tenue]|uniref:F-box domain-containing protein n=1 Tax=Linum tenue TaxID=586396 RepID=A0AAV0L1S8_9ROSI|nr:unnamed protein product [Linum tenue]
MSAGGGSRMQIDGWLPEELTIEILSRLPSPSTVGRCRCVSRWWRDILSDPEFIRKSIMPPAPPRTARVMIPRRATATTPFSIHCSENLRLLDSGKLPTDSGRGYIAGCASGIFCIGTGIIKGKIVLWNPTNSETYTLPRIPPPFGRSRSHVMPIGFGFDPDTKDYKADQGRANCEGRRKGCSVSQRLPG